MSNKIQAFTKLVQADFTIVNQNSHIIYDYSGGICLSHATQSGTTSVTTLVKSAPTTPYSCTIYLSHLMPWNGTGGQGAYYGPVFRDSGTGKFIYLAYYTQCSFFIRWMNSPTSESSNTQTNIIIEPTWWKLRDDNVNLYCDCSRDGINFTNIWSQARTTFLNNPNQIGIGSAPIYRANYLNFSSFKIETYG